MSEVYHKKLHRYPSAGRKADKKSGKSGDKKERHNPKAFTFSGGIKSVQRRVQRSLDISSKREKIPGINKKNVEGDNPPPYVVIVQGPPGVGKSTLIRSLVKHYTKYNLNIVEGPITLVSSKNRRLTIIECPNDMHGMIDVAKVADLVLLLVDASFSFEMETFEFLNILQVHGFPRVIGVLTHLDKFKDNKTLRKTKKKMKNRFWTEIYHGAKLFYLSGIQNTLYNRTEIRNLARFIAVQKFENLSWRSSHPYVVALKVEQVLDSEKSVNEDKETNKKLSMYLYGHIRGGLMRQGQNVHLPGLGDFIINKIDKYPDPCPLPETRINKDGPNAGLRTLKAKERIIYAPYCDVGNIQVDSNDLYIHIPNTATGFTRRKALIEDTRSLDSESEESTDNETSEQKYEEEYQEDYEEYEGEYQEDYEEEYENKDKEEQDKFTKRKTNNKGDDSLDEDNILLPEAVRYVRDLQDAHSFLDKKLENTELRLLSSSNKNLDRKLDLKTEDEKVSSEGNCINFDSSNRNMDLNFKQKSLKELIYSDVKIYLKEKLSHRNKNSINISDRQVKNLFEDEENEGEPSDNEFSDLRMSSLIDTFRVSDISLYPIKLTSLKSLSNYWKSSNLSKIRSEKFITGGIDDSEYKNEHLNLENQSIEYKNGTSGEIANESLKSKSSSLAIGEYVRIKVDGVNREWLNLRKGVTVIGTILPGESTFGYIRMRAKKHRWYPKILKSNDVLTFSIGWRRFQSLPIYSIEDRNETRQRMLKYTPEHMHCICTTWGPIIPPNFGILAIRTSERAPNFRISMTAVSVEIQAKSDIVKKLKLVGEPKKIYKHTAFIGNMFNSDLEVSKFIGAKVQTVSGIRGQIKKAIDTNGLFRATFEDKVLMSDIVFCKTWITVNPREFYNPVIDLPEWRRLRTQAELRNELGLSVPFKSDSIYIQKQDRPTKKRFNETPVPVDIEKDLPFTSRTKNNTPKQKGSLSREVAVIMSSYEKRVANLFQRLSTIQKERQIQRIERKKVAREIKMKRRQPIEKIREAKNEERIKRRYALKGIKLQRQRKKLRLEE
ncbi:hypothetical protein cand_025150 [Cryptosporidium andersoni]|uniref:Bms1-type G domain-containing protein n=1 Tax=Cryptosporidium andersoni TaxID=117008 RepID=A0A1J4MEA8_9CRYT|nr:hypothetical protein cand_025150 [Cryptosporidium andersoni]